MDTLAEFVKRHKTTEAAHAFACSLADYCHGLQIKTGEANNHNGSVYAEYRPKLRRAQHELRNVPNGTARLMCALVDFQLNVFGDWEGLAATNLEAATSFFRSAAGGGTVLAGINKRLGRAEVADKASTTLLCPVDYGTARLLELAGTAWDDRAALTAKLKTAQELAANAILDEYDVAKAQVVTAVAAGILDDKDALHRATMALRQDSVFGAWAEEVQDKGLKWKN